MGKIEKEYGMTEAELRRLLQKGNKKPRVIKKHITEDEYKIGVVSDTHLGSTDEALDELHTMYEIFRKVGIKEVLHAGDILQGQKMFPGWEMETNVFGAINQVKHCINNYPRIPGINTYFITGNHCLSFWKQSGTDVGEMIAEKRDDLIYLGQYSADVEIGEIKVKLIHPDGGCPYALSYRGQKISEQIPSGQKPHILVVGH